MKHFTLSVTLLSITTSLQASPLIQESYLPYINSVVGIALVSLSVLLYQSRKRLQAQKKLLEEKEEKIDWLRQMHATNEHKQNSKIQTLEKEIVSLKHTIEMLEQKAKEGTKNQVVAKLEALKEKRERLFEHLTSKK